MENLPANCKPNRWDLLLAAAVLALALLCGARFWGLDASADALTVAVSIDGAEVERFALTEGFAARSYTGNGYTLTVSAAPGGVCVSASDCPTQDCVHTGTISRAGQSIICLPAHIIVSLEGAQSGFDLIAG